MVSWQIPELGELTEGFNGKITYKMRDLPWAPCLNAGGINDECCNLNAVAIPRLNQKEVVNIAIPN